MRFGPAPTFQPRTMRLLLFSGSGLSADSGLRTFRGAGGLYDGVPAEGLLSAAQYRRDPRPVEAFHAALRAEVRAVEPNAMHRWMAAQQAAHPAQTVLLTQNVDDLLERAGARDVVHLHGSLFQLRCLGRDHPHPLGDPARPLLPGDRCPRCQSRTRSDVVLFGERAPAYAVLHGLVKRLTREDLVIVVGTQGSVIPIGQILRGTPARRVLLNLHESPDLNRRDFHTVILGRAVEHVAQLDAIVTQWRQGQGSASTPERPAAAWPATGSR